jgi:hypothetical protein
VAKVTTEIEESMLEEGEKPPMNWEYPDSAGMPCIYRKAEIPHQLWTECSSAQQGRGKSGRYNGR